MANATSVSFSDVRIESRFLFRCMYLLVTLVDGADVSDSRRPNYLCMDVFKVSVSLIN